MSGVCFSILYMAAYTILNLWLKLSFEIQKVTKIVNIEREKLELDLAASQIIKMITNYKNAAHLWHSPGSHIAILTIF